MGQNVTIAGADYSDVPSVQIPLTGGGTASFVDTTITALNAATAGDISKFMQAWVNGVKITGNMPVNLPTTQSITTVAQEVTIAAGRHDGTGKVQIATAQQELLIPGNIKKAVTILGVTGTYEGSGGSLTGEGGLVYEMGSWTPSDDVAHGSILFSKTHSKPPMIFALADSTHTTESGTNGLLVQVYYDVYQATGTGYKYNSSADRYGLAAYVYRSSGTATSASNIQVQYNYTDSGSSSSAYARFWADESGIYPYGGSTSRYWLSDKTYKWIAIFAQESGGNVLLSETSLGAQNITATTATNLNKSVTASGINGYDGLLVVTTDDTPQNGHLVETRGFIWLTASSSSETKNGGTIATTKSHRRLSSSGVETIAQSTTAYGIYPYSISISSGTATIAMYGRYASTTTTTINGTFTTRVYGIKLPV